MVRRRGQKSEPHSPGSLNIVGVSVLAAVPTSAITSLAAHAPQDIAVPLGTGVARRREIRIADPARWIEDGSAGYTDASIGRAR